MACAWKQLASEARNGVFMLLSVCLPFCGFAQPKEWSYPPGILSVWELDRARAYMRDEGLRVRYDGSFREPVKTVEFRKGADGVPFTVTAAYTYGVPCVPGTGYEARVRGEWLPNGDWRPCDVFATTGDLPPHRVGYEPAELKPTMTNGLWDAGREVVAYVRCRSEKRPVFRVGESAPEAWSEDPAGFEQTCLAVPTGERGVWKSHVPLAFRYVRFTTPVDGVTLVLDEPALKLVRTFAGGTARERRIWDVSAETLRLCSRHFYVDAVKRDRLPWAGDLAVSLLSSAASFRDGQTVRNSLDVLDCGDPRDEVNGIVDYSDWWVICHALYRRHFDDLAFTRSRWSSICRRTDSLMRLADEDGFIRGTNAWLFIDHGVGGNSNLGPRTTPLNILQYAALTKAADLADELGERTAAARWRGQAATLRANIRRAAFDPVRGLFRCDVFDTASPFRRHANFLAMLFGVAEKDECARIAGELAKDEMPEVGTTWMSAIECVALLLHGHRDEVSRRIESVWGGMLDRGATTFWESWQPMRKGDAVYGFYGRPFGLALCHTTSTGPLFLLPMLYEEHPVNPFE